MADAVCAKAPKQENGFDPFFPKRGEAIEAMKIAKAMCNSCPVREACAEYRRLTDARFGIWAGELYNPQKAGT